jgi:DNA-3-methyladenine glycosylase II
VDFLRGFGPMAGEQYLNDNTITKALIVDGKALVVKAREEQTESPEITYELFSEDDLTDDLEKAAADRMSFFLSLDDDIRPFYSIAENDPPFYPKVKELWGLHQVKFPALLEVSCWAIINQRIHRSAALRMKRALVERYGEHVDVGGEICWAFPDYERLRAATPRELLVLIKNQRTAERLGSLLMLFDELNEDFLRTAPYEKAVERLQKVRGIGDWSAQFILFRGLGRVERLQYSMKPVLRMMNELYGPNETLDDINRRFGSWSGYWSLYLWGSSMASRNKTGST